MKNILVVFFIFLAINPAVALPIQKMNTDQQQAVIKSKSLQTICNSSKSTFLITYPQVKKLGSKAVENKINHYLKKQFTGFKNGKCNDDNLGGFYQEDINYEVKFNKKGLLSIYYLNVGSLKRSAHPTNLLDSFNFSIISGKPIAFKDIFRKDKNYIDKIDQLIKKSLASQKIDFEYHKRSNYDFYLKDNQLVIINLFESHAMQAAESEINFNDIMDIVDKKGPLQSLF